MREQGVRDAAERGGEAPQAPGADHDLHGAVFPGHLDQTPFRRAVRNPGLSVNRDFAGEPLDQLPTGGVELVVKLANRARDRVREGGDHVGHDQPSGGTCPARRVLERHPGAKRAVHADGRSGARGHCRYPGWPIPPPFGRLR